MTRPGLAGRPDKFRPAEFSATSSNASGKTGIAAWRLIEPERVHKPDSMESVLMR